ncbi:hypothetical protein KQI84_07025 [bacterium]|nr:hypothetical protein [bacterium]
MGRTLPTFNTYLQEEIDSWRPFRRALRREHQAAFDRLFTRARRHTAEATHVARPVPFDSLVMAILLDQELEIERLRKELEKIAAGD